METNMSHHRRGKGRGAEKCQKIVYSRKKRLKAKCYSDKLG